MLKRGHGYADDTAGEIGSRVHVNPWAAFDGRVAGTEAP